MGFVAGSDEAEAESSILRDGQLVLAGGGRVIAALFEDCLTWHRVADGKDRAGCKGAICGLGQLLSSARAEENNVRLQHIYAVERLEGPEEVKPGSTFSKPVMMHGFVVHTFRKEPTKWVPREIRFFHEDPKECQAWVDRIGALLKLDPERPKKLLVFVNPYGGHRRGQKRWEECRVLFDRAGINLDVVVTSRRGHAYDVMEGASEEELTALDGIVVVGGDGFFNEVLNGLAKRRHLAPPCRKPKLRCQAANGSEGSSCGVAQGSPAVELHSVLDEGIQGFGAASGARNPGSVCPELPSLQTSLLEAHNGSAIHKGEAHAGPGCDADKGALTEGWVNTPLGEEGAGVRPECLEGPEASDAIEALSVGLNLPKKIRVGIIPAGSTDCIVMSATGSRDPVTAALHIVLGERMPLDIVRISSWGHGPLNVVHAKETSASEPLGKRISLADLEENFPGVASPRYTAGARGDMGGPGAPSPGQVEARAVNGGGNELADLAAEAQPCFPAQNHSTAAALQHTDFNSSHVAEGSSAEALGAHESSHEDYQVRYAASFVGYGFYGDVARHSEELRWMGPARYDYAGFMTYMRHKSYSAEVSYLRMPPERENSLPAGPWPAMSQSHTDMHHRRRKGRELHSHRGPRKGDKRSFPAVCTMGCLVCAQGQDFSRLARASVDLDEALTQASSSSNSQSSAQASPERQHLQSPAVQAPRWRTVQGAFHSVGAAVMSCRNEKAPDGVAAHAHLADGHLHLILIRRCTRPEYLMQLLRLTWKGADPLDFKFVEHHKTPAFTFVAQGKRSLWNVDGELLDAKEVSGQVFRGLIDIFANGPEC